MNHFLQIRQGRFRLPFVGFIIDLLIHDFQESYVKALGINLENKQVGLVRYYRGGEKKPTWWVSL